MPPGAAPPGGDLAVVAVIMVADGERVLLACLSASFLPDGTVWAFTAR